MSLLLLSPSRSSHPADAPRASVPPAPRIGAFPAGAPAVRDPDGHRRHGTGP
ncbi:hypothetical protein [Streptomyces sp. NPDC002490]|uniref:hypothetical protein n=1 Tax=Streptomyces sp. NPDC002490 TaxID=3154416 RepID=UPI00332E6481